MCVAARNRKKIHLTNSFERNPRTQGHEILSRKSRDLEAAQGKDVVILACTVLIQCQGVTGGQTDRRTPRRWLRRAKHSAIARKNSPCQFCTRLNTPFTRSSKHRTNIKQARWNPAPWLKCRPRLSPQLITCYISLPITTCPPSYLAC